MKTRRYLLRPPYASDNLTAISDGKPADAVARGAVLVLAPERDATVGELADELRDTQQRAPYTTIVLWLDLARRRQASELTLCAAEHAVRGCITAGNLNVDRLRVQITDAAHLANDIEYRLRVIGFPPNGAANQLVAHAVRNAERASASTN
jgi:hypothetical protein